MSVTFVLLEFGRSNHRKTHFLRQVPLELYSHADSCGFIYPGVGYMSLGFLLPQNTGVFLGSTFLMQSLIEWFVSLVFPKNVKHVAGVYYPDK